MKITGATTGLLLLAFLALVSACSSGGSGGDGATTGGGDVLNPGVQNGRPSLGDESPRREDGTLAYVGTPGLASCSIADVNAWIEHDMRDYYLYYDQVPVLDTAAYDDPSELVRDLRVTPDRFSDVDDAGSFGQQFEEGVIFGIGAWFYLDESVDRYRIRNLDHGSPIEQAGAVRGDLLLDINGRDPDEFIVDGHWDPRVLGEEDVEMTFTLQGEDGPPFDLMVTPTDFDWHTAPWASYYTRGGQRIGYLEVSGFNNPTADAIDDQLEWLRDIDVVDLVLDLRYNGGGRTWVARRLAAQIAGTGVEGEVYTRLVSNEKYPEFESVETFEVPELTLDLPRVVVLVTDSTASASEALVNGLEPYVDVTVIGTRSLGKPFVSVGVDYCERTLSAMRWISVNAVGVSVADGIVPDCEVEDEFRYAARDERDRLLAAGLDYLTDGVCRTAPLVAARERGRSSPVAVPPHRRAIALRD